jgi:hypothetical protein
MSYSAAPHLEAARWSFRPWPGQTEREPPGAALVVRRDEAGLGWRAAFDETSVLSDLYTFANYSEVRRFLLRDAEARALLFDAFPRMTRVFGTGAQLTLEVLQDPDDEQDMLTVLVRTGLDPSDALARLRTFDLQWWRDAAPDTGVLAIDVE